MPEWLQTVRCASKSSQPFDPTRYNSTQHTGRFHLGPSGCTEPLIVPSGSLERRCSTRNTFANRPGQADTSSQSLCCSLHAAFGTRHAARGMLHVDRLVPVPTIDTSIKSLEDVQRRRYMLHAVC